MRKFVFLTCLMLIMSISWTALAMDLDDLFGGDLFVEYEEDETALRPEEALLVQDGWDVGGSYNLSVNASRTFIEGLEPIDTWRTSLGGNLYLDARPDPDFRVFGKMGLNYAVSKDKSEDPLNLSLQELFADFNYDNQVFFRAGKQNVKWGVGYFYSPADVISVGRIDPSNPEKEIEGPVALRVHYPRGSTNYYFYTLFDGVTEPSEVGLAPKMEFVMGGTEIGLGGFYQKDKAPRAMLTLSSSLGNVAVFGEAVVGKATDQFFFQGTAGGRYSYNDPDGLFNLTGAAQYFYDEEGYETGKHKLGAMLSWNGILGSKFSSMTHLDANLSDKYSMVTSVLSLPSISKISPSVGISYVYADLGPNIKPLSNTTVFAAITLGSGSF